MKKLIINLSVFLFFIIANINLLSNDIKDTTHIPIDQTENYTIIKLYSNDTLKRICVEKLNNKKLYFIIFDKDGNTLRQASFHSVVSHCYLYKFKERRVRIQFYTNDDIIWDSMNIMVSDSFRICYKNNLKLCNN